MRTLFVSDLHLDDTRPEATDLFLRFLREEARTARALYILGDLFEAWIGDDVPGGTGEQVAAALRALHAQGVPCAFMHGNRDFLLGHAYARSAGLRLLPDPCVIALGGAPVLLSHGDAFCTDDEAYQRFRAESRDPGWRERFLAQPADARLAFARHARSESRAYQRQLASDITDVAAGTIIATLRYYGVARMIHGHTHRPAVHRHDVDGRSCERIVLGDWYEQASVLRVADDGTAELGRP